MTMGNVFMSTHDATWIAENQATMGHEHAHSADYSVWGVSMIPAYGLASAYSMSTTGSYGCANYFEINADLAAGVTRAEG